MKKYIKGTIIFILIIVIIFFAVFSAKKYHSTTNVKDNNDTEVTRMNPIPATQEEVKSTVGDTGALGGYNVLIADRGNNRIIEVTPDKKIVWEYDFKLPKMGLGADDAFFINGGKEVIVNLEEYHVIQIIDYATKKVVWSYGVPGKPGHSNGMLNTPDDAYKLPNGNITVADVKNCRVIEISPDKKIVRQYGTPGICKNAKGYLNKPNGDTPLKDGHMFISNIIGSLLVELDNNWKQIFTLRLPVRYPSDPQLTKSGNILISDYSNPGKIVELDRKGNIIWQFDGENGDVKMNHPSLSEELPNGNIISNDDYNQRIIVVDKNTNKIVWQYGVTGKPGSGPGQLNTPDGLDLIMRNPSINSPSLPNTISYSIGQVSRHASNYVNKDVTLTGYVLSKQQGYVIFSDENTGSVGQYDLPVSGSLADSFQLKQKYTFEGTLKNGGLKTINNNPYHLEVTNIFPQ